MSVSSTRESKVMEQIEAPLKDEQLYRWVRNVMIAGMLSSLALMIVGMVMFVVANGNDLRVAVPLPEIIQRVLAFDPLGIIALGIVILALTPMLSVLVSFVSFLFERDFVYAGASFVVLLVLGLSIALAL